MPPYDLCERTFEFSLAILIVFRSSYFCIC